MAPLSEVQSAVQLAKSLGKELWQDGFNYLHGTEDNPKNLNQAIRCFRAAIRVSGDAHAMDNLADIYRQRGLPKDLKNALKLEMLLRA